MACELLRSSEAELIMARYFRRRIKISRIKSSRRAARSYRNIPKEPPAFRIIFRNEIELSRDFRSERLLSRHKKNRARSLRRASPLSKTAKCSLFQDPFFP